MKFKKIILPLLLGLFLGSFSRTVPAKEAGRKRIMVISSYHREYNWTADTNRGLCDALLKYGFLDNQEQVAEYTRNDYIETAKIVMKKLWMDSKRKNSKSELAASTVKITKAAREFHPDLIMLGDDNAANYIGNQFLDSGIPIVFWGVNNTPVKYGLVESIERPGHNVTGVYQTGYYLESLELLTVIVPRVKTFAILSDETPTGRAHRKKVEYLAHNNRLPLKLVATVATSNYAEWRRKAIGLQKRVDAFYVAQFTGLKDQQGNSVPEEVVLKWYLKNIHIPEASRGHFVVRGLLCAADDSGYNQGFEAGVLVNRILSLKADPATLPPITPKRGALIVNRKRARSLGLALTEDMGIEQLVD